MQIIHQAPLAALGLGAAFTVLYGVADPVAAFAEVRTIDVTGSYVLNEELGESFQTAQDQARRDALRMAGEQAGVFVESLSDVRASMLEKDEIQAISASVLQVEKEEITSEVMEDGTINYRCHIVAFVDTASITREMLADRKALSDAVRRGKELQEESAQASTELQKLKGNYMSAASDTEKQGIRKQVKVNEKKMEALRYFEQGLALTAKKDYAEAAKAYQNAILAYPEYPVAHLELGNSFYHMGKPDLAMEYIGKASSLQPGNATAYFNMGVICYDRGDYGKAIHYLEKAIQTDPQYADAYVSLGLAYKFHGAGDPKKAAQCYAKAIAINPKDASAYNNIGSIYYDMKGYGEAIPYFQKAIQYNPWLVQPYDNLMKCYAYLGKYDDVEAWAERALAAVGHLQAFVAQGDAYYYAAKDMDRAAISYNNAVQSEGGKRYAPALAACGDLLREIKEYDSAEKAYEAALSIEPENLRASLGLNLLKVERGLKKISELNSDTE